MLKRLLLSTACVLAMHGAASADVILGVAGPDHGPVRILL